MKSLIQKSKNLLLWSQKYTRTDMLYLTQGGFWLTLNQFAGAALSLILSVAFANLVAKETYGAYRYVLSVVNILSIATLPQMGAAVTQAVARGDEGPVRHSLRTKLRWGSLGSIAGALLAGYYWLNGNAALAAALLVAAAFVPFYNTFTIYDALMTGRKRFDLSTKYGVAVQVISAAALLLTLIFTKDVIVILSVYFGSRTAVTVIQYAHAIRRYAPNDRQDPSYEPYGKHLTVIGIMSTIANYADQILVYHFLGAAPLAVYSMAMAPIGQVKGFLNFIPSLMLPNYAKRDSGEIRTGIVRKYLLLFICGIFIVTAYILAAPFLYSVFLPNYRESVIYSQIFSISLLNMALAPATVYLMAKRKIKEQYYSSIITSLFQIASMCVGVIKWGLLGLVVARVLARYVGSLVNLYYYRSLGSDKDEASAAPVGQG